MILAALFVRAPLWGGAAVVVLGLAACSSREDKVIAVIDNNRCMTLADSVKTLQPGDELPRVVQVIGEPNRAYRVIAPFGKHYDVLEYDVGASPCARLVLRAPKKLELVFDGMGRYIGAGREVFLKLQAATVVRVNGLPFRSDDFEF